MALKGFQDLKVWQKAMDLVEAVYVLTRLFPADERFGLTAQMRDAGVSIPSNIAEGYGRLHRKEYIHHLSIARGSLMKVQTHTAIAARLKYATRDQLLDCWRLSEEVGRMLNKMIPSLQRAPRTPANPNARTPNPSTLDPNPSTLDPNPSTLDPNPSTLAPDPFSLNPNP